MTYKEAHDWCLKKGAVVYFHPKEVLDGTGLSTIGKVQFIIKQGGSAGDTLIEAIENWIHWQNEKRNITSKSTQTEKVGALKHA